MHGFVSRLERVHTQGDTIRERLKRAFGLDDPLKIVPYLGYGTATKMFLNGRVIEDEGIEPSKDDDTILQNLLGMYKRWETDEVPEARVRIRFGDFEQDIMTNAEGYFSVEFNPAGPRANQPWQTIALELLHPQSADGTPIRAQSTGQVLVPPPGAKFGVISDIDDTIIQSHVGDRVKMVLTVALRNARTRLPFEGVAAFYRALQQGVAGNENNPIFYVSKSPWNLFDLLVEFLRIHAIPVGPLFLRDFGLQMVLGPQEQQDYKISKIVPLLDLYANMPFILIGDSGEQDPEIYTEIVRKYPERIRASITASATFGHSASPDNVTCGHSMALQ